MSKINSDKKNMQLIINSDKPIHILDELGYLSPFELIEPNLSDPQCRKLIYKIFTNIKYLNKDYLKGITELLSKPQIDPILLDIFYKAIGKASVKITY